MAQSTAPIVVLTALSVASKALAENQPVDLRIVAAGGIAAGMFALAERGAPDVVPAVAWLALVTVVFVRLDGRPTPAEKLLAWWQAPIDQRK